MPHSRRLLVVRLRHGSLPVAEPPLAFAHVRPDASPRDDRITNRPFVVANVGRLERNISRSCGRPLCSIVQISPGIATPVNAPPGASMDRRTDLPREIAGVRLPDSALALKAVDLVFRVSPPAVQTHVVRTFVFGSLVGKAQGLRYDDELVFLGAVLHDLGLTAAFRVT